MVQIRKELTLPRVGEGAESDTAFFSLSFCLSSGPVSAGLAAENAAAPTWGLGSSAVGDSGFSVPCVVFGSV